MPETADAGLITLQEGRDEAAVLASVGGRRSVHRADAGRAARRRGGTGAGTG